jgi:heme oxygenase (biliverdin-producing, ferredoxin)
MTVTALHRDAAGFAFRLRTATRAQHEQAEESGFMSALIAGELPLAGYTALAGQLWHVYGALEGVAADLRDHPVAGPFIADELFRLPALEADLAYLLGPDWRDDVPATTAAADYAARIRKVASTWPEGYVAHHYTRYLGDLSGGQILRRGLQRNYRLTDDGLTFFVFDDIAKPKVFKDNYRDLLDRIGLDTAGQDRVIDEARLAFELNTAVFATLGSRFLPTTP